MTLTDLYSSSEAARWYLCRFASYFLVHQPFPLLLSHLETYWISAWLLLVVPLRTRQCVSEHHLLLLLVGFNRIRLTAMNKKGHEAQSLCAQTNMRETRPFCFSSGGDELKRAERWCVQGLATDSYGLRVAQVCADPRSNDRRSEQTFLFRKSKAERDKQGKTRIRKNSSLYSEMIKWTKLRELNVVGRDQA